MAQFSIWFDGKKAGGKYSVVDASTREPVVGNDGKPLTDLSFKGAVELIEELNRQRKS
jgi:hypothetical protein